MNYPKHIYRKFKIVEKDVLGVKHYAAKRLFCIFGVCVWSEYVRIAYDETYFVDSPLFGTTWIISKARVERCIEDAKIKDEQSYRWRLIK